MLIRLVGSDAWLKSVGDIVNKCTTVCNLGLEQYGPDKWIWAQSWQKVGHVNGVSEIRITNHIP